MFASLGGTKKQVAQDEDRRGAADHHRRRGRQARQRRRDQGERARQRRAERHRLHRRDRQGRLALGDPRSATSRARACSATCCRSSRARPSTPSTGWSRPTTSCSSPRARSTSRKPSDLIPELQGRFPIRVELGSLSVDDFEAILTQTHASLVKQYTLLLATEGVRLELAPDAIRRIAQIAFDVNERTENIGARRLATVMERLLDEVSFDAPNRAGQTVRLDGDRGRREARRARAQRGSLALHPVARRLRRLARARHASLPVQTGSQRTSLRTEFAM